MKRLIGVLITILILVLLCTGVFADILRFFAWLFTLQYSQPETSIAGGIIVRILTFAVSYSLVGAIFGLVGLFNSKAMSIAYLIISTLLGFALAYIVWIVEQHILIIGIVLAVIFVGIIIFLIITWILNKNKHKRKSDSGQK